MARSRSPTRPTSVPSASTVGASPGVPNLLFVSGEVGIGLGVILGGQARLGAAGYAGEAGHTLVNPAGTRCRCGAIGCWETEAGEGALLRLCGPAVGEGGRASIDRVMALAAAGDADVLGAIESIGRWLGIGIGDLINLFNPELVILGGMFDRLYPLIEPSMREGCAAGCSRRLARWPPSGAVDWGSMLRCSARGAGLVRRARPSESGDRSRLGGDRTFGETTWGGADSIGLVESTRTPGLRGPALGSGSSMARSDSAKSSGRWWS